MNYPELKDAIEKHALHFAKDGIRIIAHERTGSLANWVFDFRALLLQPHWLNRYAEIFWEQYGSQYPFQVCGMETAGIPLVAAIVMKSVERGTPVNGFYIRKSRKRYNLTKQIEGIVTDDPIILVDDLLNSGQTVAKECALVHETGKTISDIFVLLQFRDTSAYEPLYKNGIRLKTLYTLTDFGLSLLSSDAPSLPRESFEILWRFAGPDPSYHLVVQKSAPQIDAERIYFGADDGYFYCLDQESGRVIWKFRVGENKGGKRILSTSLLYEEVVYFGAYDGNFYALEAKTGAVKWIYGGADWIGSSPALSKEDGLIYIGLEYGLVGKQGGAAAIDFLTGKEVWRASHSSLTHASPLYIKEERLVVIGSNNGMVYAYEAHSGKPRWSFASRGDIKTTAAYDPSTHRVFIPSMDGRLYALDARTGIPQFAREMRGGIYSIPLVHADKVYVASLDKKVYALETTEGKDLWSFETGGRIFSSPLLVEGSLWIGSNDGKMYELDPDTGTLRTYFQATERIVNKIAYNKNTKRFFVPTVANEIYCLKRKG
jgi:outer membrane protein assembly factor BamB